MLDFIRVVHARVPYAVAGIRLEEQKVYDDYSCTDLLCTHI